MGINQNDLRVIKTKRGLREAFIRLLLEKGYDAISIQDIATEAEAARVTFYRHYRNKEELLLDCLEVVYEELLERVKQVTAQGVQQEYLPLMVFYEHVQEKEDLYQILFSSQGAQFLITRLTELMAKRTKEQIENRVNAEQLLVPIEIIANHIGNALIGLVVWWLENEKPYPPEYMAQLSYWLSFAGNARALGFDQYQVPPPQMQE
ncbi:TetR/AcrR family transcriptional regulator [bacterium]|nr:TetR/AcrR family transcriptional regulator [bacterium]